MVKKKKATKKSARKGKKAPKRTARTAPKKTARKAVKKAAPRKAARKSTPVARRSKPAKAKKASPARKGAFARGATVATFVAAAGSPAGEVYGEEGWREEELSAAELETDASELGALEAEPEGPEIASESDEDPEW